MPLGDVLSHSAGELKNILVERVDSMETTLAHIFPEFTANILAPIGILILLFVTDWRMALVSLITLPLGMLCYMGMMMGYADQIIVIDQGRIVQKGKHEELIRQDGIYRNFVLEREKAISWKLA